MAIFALPSRMGIGGENDPDEENFLQDAWKEADDRALILETFKRGV